VNGAQVGEDGEDPAMVVAAFGEIELEENVMYVGLHGAFADDEPLPDIGVGKALRHELQYPAKGQLLQFAAATARSEIARKRRKWT
jgi:hypothetical protein